MSPQHVLKYIFYIDANHSCNLSKLILIESVSTVGLPVLSPQIHSLSSRESPVPGSEVCFPDLNLSLRYVSDREMINGKDFGLDDLGPCSCDSSESPWKLALLVAGISMVSLDDVVDAPMS